jgi:hypothetical protein
MSQQVPDAGKNRSAGLWCIQASIGFIGKLLQAVVAKRLNVPMVVNAVAFFLQKKPHVTLFYRFVAHVQQP